MAIMMVAMLSVGFASCGDDDDSSSNDSDEVECWGCSGSGECFLCDGVGHKDCRCIRSHAGTCEMCKGTGRWYNDTCPMCSGSGLCQYCYGTLKETCEECKGSGICEKCGGIGKLTANGDRLPGYGDNGNGDNGGSGGSGNGDNGGSGGGSTKRKCVLCGGLGHCDNITASYIIRKYYCLGSGKCQWCSGTGQTNDVVTGDRVRCDHCNSKLNNNYGDGKCGKCGGSGKCHSCGGDGYKQKSKYYCTPPEAPQIVLDYRWIARNFAANFSKGRK